MKILALLLKRVFNNPFMFVMTVFQTAVISVAMLGVYNAYTISHACVNSICGDNRMIYRSCSSDFDNSFYTAYIDETEALMKDCKEYLGTSFVASGLTYLGDNASLEIARRAISGKEISEELNLQAKYEDFATTYFYNEITLKSIKYPLFKGNWNDIYSEKKGILPCFVGGNNAAKYQIGDIIQGYTFNRKADGIVGTNYIVVGILRDPVFLFSANSGQTDYYSAMKISEAFKVGINEPIVLVTNSSLAENYDIEMSDIRPNYFVFFDGKTSNERMEQYAIKLGDSYAAVDTDMIASEKIEVTRVADMVFPVVVILLVISLSAVVSTSIISFLDGMTEYRIYFIFGCTRNKMLLVSALYSLCYLVASWLLTSMLVKLVHAFIHSNFKPYFMENPIITALLMGAFTATIAVSVVIPFVFQKTKNIKELILKTID